MRVGHRKAGKCAGGEHRRLRRLGCLCVVPCGRRTDVAGHVNIAYLFALSQFFVAWVLAWFYIRRANSLYDRLAATVRDRAARGRRPAA